METTKHVPRLLRVREAAELTGLERWRFYDLLKKGEGPPYRRIGRTIRISETALIEWIDAARTQEQHGGEE